jgi:hypothetical protein
MVAQILLAHQIMVQVGAVELHRDRGRVALVAQEHPLQEELAGPEQHRQSLAHQ